MKQLAVAKWILVTLLLSCVATLPACRQDPTTTQIDVRFSPKGGCTERIIEALDRARESVLVQAYSFTSAPIAKALVDAHKRGVDVTVILDSSQRSEKYSSADFLVHMGIPTYIDDRHAIAHNKVMILDDTTVVTGSFNFTKSAEEHNAENLLVIRDPALAAQYTANWKKHLGHSEEYGGRESGEGDSRPSAGAKGAASGGKSQADDDSQDEYVSSSNSEVFHRRGCRLAAKISEKNLVGFATRGEAISAGKRPCTECKP